MTASLRARLARLLGSALRRQRGASAVVMAILMTVVMASGALAFDVSKLVYERQQVRAAVDAAAQVGAARLTASAMGIPAANDLVALIKNAAVSNYGSSTYGPGLTAGNVSVVFYCVVANTSGTSTVAKPDANQIPSTCRPNPASTDYTTGTRCSATSCAIPCNPVAISAAVCNAIQVSAQKVVQFVFAPAINISQGSAAAATLSCRGTCGGQAAPNPLNVVVMADRTGSMLFTGGSTSLNSMNALKDGISSMLTVMTPDQQYVAFGAVHKSMPTTANPIAAVGASSPFFTQSSWNYTAATPTKANATNMPNNCAYKYAYHSGVLSGDWVPVDYENDYLSTNAAGSATLKTGTDLYKGVTQLPYSVANWTTTNNQFKSYCTSDGYDGGTHLASAMKGAARYLLDTSNLTNNIPAADLAARAKLGVAKNVIIFETDGQPGERFTNASSDGAAPLQLGNASDIGSIDGTRACQNFAKVAAAAKAAGITLVTIGFGSVNESSAKCGSQPARVALAAAASTKASVTGSGDSATDCSTSAEVSDENTDGDLYYCAATGNDLRGVFLAAMGAINGQTKYMAIDGVAD